jgi:hypothetical protein
VSYLFEDPLGAHLRDVDTVTAALGTTAPKPWRDLRSRWENHNTAESYADQYVAALVTGDTKADLPLLRSLAISFAATLPTHTATIDNYAKATVERKLLELFAPDAPRIYTAAAQNFNDTVTKFLHCTTVVDVGLPAEQLLDATDEVRSAWVSAQIHAHAIDGAVEILAAAARLSGTAVGTPEEVLPLICRTDGVHRRELWTAYESESRCGRWPALAQITEILAAELPVEPYRRPLPLQEKWIQNPNGGIGNVRILVDPEDAELAEAKG